MTSQQPTLPAAGECLSYGRQIWVVNPSISYSAFLRDLLINECLASPLPGPQFLMRLMKSNE